MKPVTVDILTIMFVLAVINSVSTLFLAAALRMSRGRGGNLGLFLLDKFFQGLSWAVRLAVYLGAPSWLNAGGNLFLVLGYSLEAALFFGFKGPVGRRVYAAAGGSVLLSSLGLVLLDGSGLENAIILVTYLLSMSLVAWRLLLKDPTTRFQRLLGLIYGSFPLASVMLYVAAGAEVTSTGHTTSPTGLAYYVAIITMQMVGSVGYLLMVKERDEDALAEAASSDALTGILNRRAFFERAELIIANAIRGKDALAAIMIDLDHFKRINDSHGHLVGDRVIRHFCDTVRWVVRKGDLFARYGGEEFAILLPRASRDEAEILVRRLRADLSLAVREQAGYLPPFTASIGLATGTARQAEDLDRLLDASDRALYRAKADGRDRAWWLALGAPDGTAERLRA